MKNGPKMSDIAKRLHISTVTVSKALAGKEGVSEETRLKIKQLAWEIGYHYKPAGRKEAPETFMIGIVLDGRFLEPRPSFYWTMYQQLIETLKTYGYYGIMEIYRGVLELPDFITQNRVDGIITVGFLPNPYLQMLFASDLPTVNFDSLSSVPRTVSVLPDNIQAAAMATSYLIGMGHTKIGFVGSIQTISNIRLRYLGYYNALLERQLPLEPLWILEDRKGYAIFQEYQLPEEMPSAFVCNSDQTAYHFIQYLTKIGYRVPQDVSVVGFYDYEYATMEPCSITTIKIDVKQMAFIAVNVLIRFIQRKAFYGNVISIEGTVVERDTVLDMRA